MPMWLLYFTICLLLFFAVTELVLRVWLKRFSSKTQIEKYALISDVDPLSIRLAPHPYLGYFNTPNYRKGLKSHNSMGFRNAELPIKKPEGTFRIAVFGGSTVYTELVEDNGKQFTTQLENVLSEDYGYRNIQIINAGVAGYTSYESLIDLALRVLDFQLDLIIIYHGTNDCHTRFCALDEYRGDNSGYRKHWGAPRIQLWENVCLLRIPSRLFGLSRQVMLEQFVEQPTAEDPDADQFELLRAHPPVYYERNLENTIAIAKHHGIEIMFSTWAHSPGFQDYAATPHYIQAFREMNEVVENVAKKNDIPLFNFAAVMPKEIRYWGDGRHVNEEGALLKAQLFGQFIHDQGLIPNTCP